MFYTLLKNVQNVEVSDTTGDATCTAARNKKILFNFQYQTSNFKPVIFTRKFFLC